MPHPSPDEAYAHATSIVREIGTIADMSRRTSGAMPRDFWLRKAALVDRIALKEEATFSPEVAAPAVRAAEAAAEQLLAYDRKHGTRCGRFSPDSLSSPDSTDGQGHRAYVRQEYLAWSPAEYA
jgi:hypothetical protein